MGRTPRHVGLRAFEQDVLGWTNNGMIDEFSHTGSKAGVFNYGSSPMVRSLRAKVLPWFYSPASTLNTAVKLGLL
jgi:hypothetical protein